MISDWLELDSEDHWVRHDSEIVSLSSPFIPKLYSRCGSQSRGAGELQLPSESRDTAELEEIIGVTTGIGLCLLSKYHLRGPPISTKPRTRSILRTRRE